MFYLLLLCPKGHKLGLDTGPYIIYLQFDKGTGTLVQYAKYSFFSQLSSFFSGILRGIVHKSID